MGNETEPNLISAEAERSTSLPLDIVVRRRPGATRWARWAWQPVAVLPSAAPADWKVLRHDEFRTELHAATLPLELHRAEVEAYRVSLTMDPPAVFVVLREGEADGPEGTTIHAVTASAYEAQDYMDSGEEMVEAVPMPDGLIVWIRDFVERHRTDMPFVKRKRDRYRIDLVEDGIGDVRIRQAADVYRSPAAQKPANDRTS